MRVKLIRIQNILGIEDLEIRPGKHGALITGANGTGKTSVLEALKAVAKGGHDATLIRKGAEEGRVVWVFEDDVEVTKRVRPHTSDVDVRHPTMGKISTPQTYLNGLMDQLSINPLDFFTASSPADRVQKLLEAMPLELDREALKEAVAGTDVELNGASTEGVHPLVAIASAHHAVYDERTAVNRVVRENRTTAEQLRASLPDDDDGDAPDLEWLENKRHEYERALAQKLGKVDAETEQAVSEVKDHLHEVTEQLREEIRSLEREAEEQVAKIRSDADGRKQDTQNHLHEVTEQLREEIRSLEREAEEQVAKIRSDADGRKQDTQIDEQPAINRLGEEISAARERLKAQGRYENTRKMVEEATEKAEKADEQSRALTAALTKLEGLKGKLLAEMPIPGVEIRDGEVYREGIPVPRLNTAAQVELAVQLAKLRAGEVPLVCMDGMECLDQRTYELFMDAVADAGLEAVVTRVTDGPLTVEPIGEAEEALR